MNGVEAAKQRILSRVPLADFVGQHLTLQRRSGRYVGLCPFHGEKSPSFTLYDDRYFCFGCRERGDLIDFARFILGIGFMDALKYLAEKYGIEAPELQEAGQWKVQGERKANLYRANTAAHEFFVSMIRRPEGKGALQYLAKRGFADEEIVSFGFGFSPGTANLSDRSGAANSLMTSTLKRQGITEDELLSSALSWQGRQQVFDFFRNRLTIPIKDPQGRIIGFGGRTLGDEQPKYLNSKETPLFDKGRVLFGLDRAKGAIRERGRALIVEGYMDAISLWSHGFPEAVACLGTALTVHHLRLLENVSNSAILIFDGDRAGQGASLKAVEMAIQVPKLNVKVAALPDALDPDEFVKERGPEALRKILDSAPGVLEYAVRETMRGVGKLEVPEVVRERFLPWLGRVQDPIARSFLMAHVSNLTSIPLSHLEREMVDSATLKAAAEVRKQDEQAREDEKRREQDGILLKARELTAMEFEIMAHLYYAKPDEMADTLLFADLVKMTNWDEPWRALFEALLEPLRKGLAPAALTEAELLGPAHTRLFEELDRIRLAAAAFDCQDRPARLRRLLTEYRKKSVRQAIQGLRQQLVGVADKSEMEALLRAIQQLNRDLIALEGGSPPVASPMYPASPP